MTTSISYLVQATIPLDSKIIANPEKYKFSKDEILPVTHANIQLHKLSAFSRFIKKIDKSKSEVIKIARIIVSLLLIVSLFGIPLIIWANSARDLIKDNKSNKEFCLYNLNKKINSWNFRAKIMEKTALDQITVPFLEMNYPIALDSIDTKKIAAPIMKGKDEKGRAFFVLHLKDKSLNHLITMHQNEEYDVEWLYNIHPTLHIPKNVKVNSFIKNIVLNNHAPSPLVS